MLSILHFPILGGLVVCVLGIHSPDRSCNTQTKCELPPWTRPYPTCVDQECRCNEGQCVIYTTQGSSIAYYCGTCGVLGSECNVTNPCVQIPMLCKTDNFCHCDQGDVYRELCVVYKPIPTTFRSDILIVTLVILLVLLRVIKSWERLKALLCRRCIRTESEESTVVGINPRSGEKSAAYTISNSDFMVTSHDSDLEWALELSRQLASPTEDWLSMRSFALSSPSLISRRRNQYYEQQISLETISEPGPSVSSEEQRDSLSLSDFPNPPSIESSSRFSVSSTYPSRRPSKSTAPLRRLNNLSFRQSRRSSSASSGSFHSADSSSIKRNAVRRSSSAASSITSRDFSSGSSSSRSSSNCSQPGKSSGIDIRDRQSLSCSSSALSAFPSSSRPSVSSETADASALSELKLSPDQQLAEPSVKSEYTSPSPAAETELTISQQSDENIDSLSGTSASSSRASSFQSLPRE
ncbi:serine-rich adhesin for platelets-like [Macrobrachium nipponense]|uniref:serine-rich adhesin for platelets-like n=1 Tax=Macrobrachium nipponense TaxID=159736 RepID=UPI0030C83883